LHALAPLQQYLAEKKPRLGVARIGVQSLA
jgi:hypothetical protein